ncbi:hypothetical protein MKX03_019434 [Papaver bracteatum]|nr:hypothetical protein MKX03_019434 [Papaver bracteatum]
MMSGNRCLSSTGEHEAIEGRRRGIDSHSESNREDLTADSYGSTSRLSGNRKQIIFEKYGRPCDIGSEKIVKEIGKIVRAYCHPTIDSWMVYEVAEIYKPNILTKANVSWKNWKHHLRLVLDKYDTIAEMKRNMPERLIAKGKDWESFVDFCNIDEDKKLVELLQSCGRNGISRTIYDLEKESITGEINRFVVFATTHVTKTINDPASTSAYDVKITHMRALVLSRETLRKVQEENKSMRSDIDLLQTQVGALVQICISSSSSSNRAPDESNLHVVSKGFIKNFKGRTIALGIYNTGGLNCFSPSHPKLPKLAEAFFTYKHVYSVILEEIFDRYAKLYDEDGTLSDIMLGEVINWPKEVSRLIRNKPCHCSFRL